MKRVLHIVGNMNMGGQETFIMNLYEHIDRSKIQFDFVVHSNEEGYYDKKIKELGGRIYRIQPISKNPIKSMIQLGHIIKENKYDILHRHTASSIIAIELIVAKILKVKKIIVHAHSNFSENKLLHKIFRPILNLFANYKMACSKEAARWLFGNRQLSSVIIINNGIDLTEFLYNNEIRQKIRRKYKVEKNIIIGHVGRFECEKNHEFVIEIFSKIIKSDNRYRLWLIGEGSLKKEIEQKAKKMGIYKYVNFFGIVDNVNELLQGMDVFIFPSIYEGLGISFIEAQVSGLKCIVSENIQQEAIITNEVVKINLKEKKLWCEEIEKTTVENRKIKIDEQISKFDINNTSKKLEKIYLEDK